MKLVAFTIVLDGMPWITKHLPIFEQTSHSHPWKWIIVEGASGNTADQSWCKKQDARLSSDGTTEYLRSIGGPAYQSEYWANKTVMVNTALEDEELNSPCVLMQIDADEIHTPNNLEKIVELFTADDSLGAIKMRCRYFVGPDLICVGDNCWSNKADEWIRAWRFEPGMKFVTHEPPVLNKMLGRIMDKDESSSHRLGFDHMAYATEAQVKFKEAFYGYDDLLYRWRRMQDNLGALPDSAFPVKLNRFFPFVDDRVEVTRI